MGNGNQTLLVPLANHQTLIFPLELTRDLDRSIRHFAQRCFDHLAALSGSTTFTLTRAFGFSMKSC